MSQPLKLWIAAGGTGGHIIPGIRVGREFEAKIGKNSVLYFSGRRDIEQRIYNDEGISPIILRSGINRSGIASLLRFPELAIDFLRVAAMMRRERPRAVLGMGGAVCFPVLFAARLLKVPIYLHESNTIPGRLVRMFARSARKVFLGLPTTIEGNTEVVGTPSRYSDSSKADREIVLCVGGSQGAASLNALFAEAVSKIQDEFPSIQFILVTGPGKAIKATERMKTFEYVSDLPSLLRRTIIAVSRSGSGALADFANHRVPAILVPYPHAMDNHQESNARVFSDAGAALLRVEADLTAEQLAKDMRELLSDTKRLVAMEDALARFDSRFAAQRIVMGILKRSFIPAIAVDPTKEVSRLSVL